MARKRAARSDDAGPAASRPAVVVAAFGRHFLVADDDAATLTDTALRPAVIRARRSDCVVGDQVRISVLPDDSAVIESIDPRRNQVTRSNDFRSKTIAANVDQAAVIISGHPALDEALLLRVLIALEAEGIPTLLVATKQDLPTARAALAGRRTVYEALGYPVIGLSARSEPASLDPLRQRLHGKRTLLLGQSGMGKSTLINALVPHADQQTREISDALSSGRHTTTFTRAFQLGDGGWLIDSPGFQTFEISHLSRWQIIHGMPEFRPLLGRCRFNDCSHRDEPACAIRGAEGIDPLRYRLFTAIEASADG